jgi:hypothetical protein
MPSELHENFPRGSHADVLCNARECFYEAAKAAGFKMIGAGIGCGADDELGSADISMETADGMHLTVTVGLKRPRQ